MARRHGHHGPRAYLPEAQRADVLAFLQATGAP